MMSPLNLVLHCHACETAFEFPESLRSERNLLCSFLSEKSDNSEQSEQIAAYLQAKYIHQSVVRFTDNLGNEPAATAATPNYESFDSKEWRSMDAFFAEMLRGIMKNEYLIFIGDSRICDAYAAANKKILAALDGRTLRRGSDPRKEILLEVTEPLLADLGNFWWHDCFFLVTRQDRFPAFAAAITADVRVPDNWKAVLEAMDGCGVVAFETEGFIFYSPSISSEDLCRLADVDGINAKLRANG